VSAKARGKPTAITHLLIQPRKHSTTMASSLCETCQHMREIISPKGSRFLLCGLSKSDARFPKYPPQPLTHCAGYCERRGTKKS